MEVIYTVCSSYEEAKKIGKRMIQEKLCACINILSGMESIYFWEGEIIEDQEVVLLIKTKPGKFDVILKKIKEIHSYEVPCVFSWTAKNVSEEYLNWLNEYIK
ncbi:MAG: divalent-cation tolerance protein CutA [Flavobacteriales bacterium]|nr:divalent-cation tolerance protein CutA [Flavobacteriales bacterium]MBO73150.1 divalent-cation tolerance protein CutA [Flavobacteriales bacterium]|tara:strand:- start:346 stop:654 length:309 start_codon:yes stop_codon:yes gene_type:complete